MAEKRRGKKRKEEWPDPSHKVVDKPSKDEYEVAKWLRNNVPVKKTKFVNHVVQYFTGSKAVDALMGSVWGVALKEGDDPFFASREHCVEFLDGMLRHKFFHRARKVPIPDDLLKPKRSKEKKAESEKEPSRKDVDKEKKEELSEQSHTEGKGGQETPAAKGPGCGSDEERKKRKRKVRLEMHLDQVFADNLDAYVWIYDPTPAYYWLVGTLVVLAGIAICLFPLWPPAVRQVVYYLSIGVAGFLVFIVVLAVVRFILFSIIWILTLGKHHFWLLPNLTEDVGFFASFWPLYQYEYKGGDGSSNKSNKKGNKKKKDKVSDVEDEGEAGEAGETGKPDLHSRSEEEDKGNEGDEGEGETKTKGGQSPPDNGSDSESSSQQSQTGKDFEILDKAELAEQSEPSAQQPQSES